MQEQDDPLGQGQEHARVQAVDGNVGVLPGPFAIDLQVHPLLDLDGDHVIHTLQLDRPTTEKRIAQRLQVGAAGVREERRPARQLDDRAGHDRADDGLFADPLEMGVVDDGQTRKERRILAHQETARIERLQLIERRIVRIGHGLLVSLKHCPRVKRLLARDTARRAARGDGSERYRPVAKGPWSNGLSGSVYHVASMA